MYAALYLVFKIHLQWIIILNLWISSGTHLFSDFLPCHYNWFICLIVFHKQIHMQQDSKFFYSFFFWFKIQLFRFQSLNQFHFYSASTLVYQSRFVFHFVPWDLLFVLRWKVCRFYSFILICFKDSFVIDKNVHYMPYYFNTIIKLFLSFLNSL